MTLEEMKRKRRELGYTYQKLSELSGVPRGTIQKIFGGVTSSPRYETLLALERVLSGQTEPPEYTAPVRPYPNMVAEEVLFSNISWLLSVVPVTVICVSIDSLSNSVFLLPPF